MVGGNQAVKQGVMCATEEILCSPGRGEVLGLILSKRGKTMNQEERELSAKRASKG